MIDIQLEQQTIAAGESLSGTVIWQSDRNEIPKSATISIGWSTEGRGTRDRKTVNKLSLDPNQFAAAQGDAIPFSLDIPDAGPITYNGNLIRVIWELKILIDMPGLFAHNDKQKWPFRVISREPR